MAVLLMGAVTIETVDQLYIQPRTVSSWGELVDCYFDARTTLPPLPFAYEDVFAKMDAGDWSFLADHWQYKQVSGTYFVAEKSKLARLKLPLHILIYEDLKRGEVVVLSSTDGESYQGEALFKAPEFMPYEEGFPLDRYASDELWPRRIVWEITLKSEADAWVDLVSRESTLAASTLSLDGGELMTMMSVPAEHANELWIGETEAVSNGLTAWIYAPSGVTNVEVYTTENLVSNVWTVAAENLSMAETNLICWFTSADADTGFFRVGNAGLDSDSDGLPDAREMVVQKTDPNDADSDGDEMPDGWELQYGFNPLFYADGGFDLDGDGLLNRDEYVAGTDPNGAGQPASLDVFTVIFYQPAGF